jgi:hypothetical protein
METNSLVTIPDVLRKLLGEPDKNTRIFRQEGTHEEMTAWFDAVCEHIGPCVSPGGAANYAAVTRPGVYKRLKAGKLTAFCFHVTGHTKTFFGGTKKLKELALVYIPVDECKAWRKELEARLERIGSTGEATTEDESSFKEGVGKFTASMHDFLNYDPKDKGKKGVRYK